jgi:L-fuculose-phosphate aldolase
MPEEKIQKDICEIGKRMYERGYVAGNDGNISVRVEDGIWATPTYVSKGFMTPDMLVKLDLDGNVIAGTMKPSSEIKMHLAVYNKRPDVNAVVHTHSPYAAAYACSTTKLDSRILAESMLFLGDIPLVEYGTPSTEELPNNLLKHLSKGNAFLLQNHGALTIGKDLLKAYFYTENLEHFCHISSILPKIGGKSVISDENIKKLQQIKVNFGL